MKIIKQDQARNVTIERKNVTQKKRGLNNGKNKKLGKCSRKKATYISAAQFFTNTKL